MHKLKRLKGVDNPSSWMVILTGARILFGCNTSAYLRDLYCENSILGCTDPSGLYTASMFHAYGFQPPDL